jgi:hypothetical protein
MSSTVKPLNKFTKIPFYKVWGNDVQLKFGLKCFTYIKIFDGLADMYKEINNSLYSDIGTIAMLDREMEYVKKEYFSRDKNKEKENKKREYLFTPKGMKMIIKRLDKGEILLITYGDTDDLHATDYYKKQKGLYIKVTNDTNGTPKYHREFPWEDGGDEYPGYVKM